MEENLRCCSQTEVVFALTVEGVGGAACIVMCHNNICLDTPYELDYQRGLEADDV